MKLAHSRQASARTLSTSRRNGAALVLVLILVVLLTALAVAMFSRAISDRQSSYSSASQSKAELLARGAIAITVGDLQQELVAGSTLATFSGVTMYSPKPSPSPSTLIPALVGSTGTGGLENLVKRSANGLKFYPTVSNYDTATYPPANRAAGTATTIASQNGRSVSLARWNRPLLLAKATPAGTDVTPVAAFVPPDWIVVARDGSNPTAWSPNMITSANNPTSAIGRYAYTIYDEGGLIDMNVAGYPTFSSAPQVGRKGTIAYADLRQLPGISSLPTSSQTKFMNNIVGWRNYSSANATGGNLGTFASGSAYTFANGISYYTAILSNTNGFLLTSNNTLNGSQSDRMFSGRQQLIKLLVQGMASSASDRANLQTALQYLGIFSRELNRPTWKPSTPTGSTIDYATLAKTPSAETSTAINRDLAAVRLPNGSTGFQRADGTQAVAGEQLLKTRFPLTRINALLNTGGTTIQRDFGLLWNSGQNHWDYVGATGSTVQTTIKRLDQVASESREPNFFELLKAVILSGSVGLGSGNANTFVASEQKYYITGTTPSNLLSSDYQIMQIGANIIDGWDSDNVPTFINFNGNELAGVENLPYLNKLVFAPYFTNHGQGDQFYAWLVPSFWNPHQNASSAAGTVRIAMKSGSMTATIVDNKNPPHSFTSGTVTGTAAAPYIEIRANAFGLPHPVSPGGSEEIGTSGSPAVQSTFMASNNYEGFFFPFSYPDPNGIDDKSADHAFPTFTGGPTFEMQININGVWKA